MLKSVNAYKDSKQLHVRGCLKPKAQSKQEPTISRVTWTRLLPSRGRPQVPAPLPAPPRSHTVALGSPAKSSGRGASPPPDAGEPAWHSPQGTGEGEGRARSRRAAHGAQVRMRGMWGP